MDAVFASSWGALVIFCLRIVDVSCDTMRVLFAIRGKRVVAGVLGFVQALVWIVAVGNAIKHLNSVPHIIGYAAGFGMGTYVGVTLEHLLAFGIVTVRIVSRHAGVEIAEALREHGHGVTESAGFGRDGTVEIINSVVRRRHLNDVLAVASAHDGEAFVTVEEPKVLQGGRVRTADWPIVKRRNGTS